MVIMMPSMRTTLTLDPDVERLIADAVHRERRSRRKVVNDALRRALTPARGRRDRVRVVAHESAVRPGIDAGRLNQLADELEDEAVLDAARRTG
jgi:hypothetical protein